MSNPWRSSKSKLSFGKAMGTIFKTAKMMFQAGPLGASLITISNIIEAVIPSFLALFMGIFITKLTQGDWDGFVLYISLTFVLAIVQTVTGHISGYFSWRMQYDIQNYALKKLYLKVTKIPLAVRELKENADKLEIAENYGLDLGWLFPRFVQTISQIVAFVTAFIVLANVSLLIAIITMVFIIPNIVLTTYRMRKEREYWKGNSVNRRRGWGYRRQLTDQKLAMEMKLYGLVPHFIKKWRFFVTRDRDQSLTVDKKLLPYETTAGVLDRIAQLGVLIYSGKQVFDGVLEIGYLVTIKTLMDNLSRSGYALTTSMNQVGLDIMNASDYFEYLELPEEDNSGVVLEQTGKAPKLEFKDVTFTYPMNTEPTIREVSFVVEPGEDIALVGENGSGKTTIIKLLLGVYRPDSGEILIDGISIDKLNKDSYYRRVGALFQDYARYEFTDLGDNIHFGDISKKKTRSSLEEAAGKAKLGDMLKNLPHGFKQILSKQYDEENGTDLSGGQWQRVALARGFFRNPEVLILDEPTAAVDAKAEYEIFQEIAKTQADKTTIIISHRFSTVRKAHKILVIDGGRVIESGTHQELIRADGLYKEMFTLQAEGYLD
jgi:ATP-binding cassette subfamily B protein